MDRLPEGLLQYAPPKPEELLSRLARISLVVAPLLGLTTVIGSWEFNLYSIRFRTATHPLAVLYSFWPTTYSVLVCIFLLLHAGGALRACKTGGSKLWLCSAIGLLILFTVYAVIDVTAAIYASENPDWIEFHGSTQGGAAGISLYHCLAPLSETLYPAVLILFIYEMTLKRLIQVVIIWLSAYGITYGSGIYWNLDSLSDWSRF